ncbi:MAG: hypothetical protein EXR86_03545 [Gammaproteobacteria bacterium]|nr:hypothetical protein [Gammaproteobacteria bacterium]
MFWLILTLLGVLMAALPQVFPPRIPPAVTRIAGIALAVLAFSATSFIVIDSNSVGHLKRVYFGNAMPPGRVIAMRGENGPQAEVLPPGMNLRPFLNVFYDIDEFPVTDIPSGSYGLLTARDGRPLSDGEFLAKGWREEDFEKMLDAEYFLKHNGSRGPQLSVLKPGKYRINSYLFDVKILPSIEVHAGEVAVIKSNVRESDDCPLPQLHGDSGSEGGLVVPIVKKGCIGVWAEALLPNRYYLNALAYSATIIPTRVQTWTYKGGYTRRQIDLVVGQDGKIEQREAQATEVPVPEDAADSAVGLTVEGWRVPLELRALVQVEPEDAPRVVASVGTLADVEDKIITPAIRSVIRNETGRPPDPEHGIEGTRVLDLITKRAELERTIERAIIPEGRKAGVTIKEVRFSDPVIPPELLLAGQRKQLAEQLRNTYIEEKKAQEERIDTEKARATADQQGELVRAEIAVQVANQTKAKLQLEGEGEKLRLTEIALGQKAQTEVLGQERVLQLAMLKEILAAASINPDLVKVPTVLVQGSDANNLTGAAAVLGSSNIVQLLQQARSSEAAGKQ